MASLNLPQLSALCLLIVCLALFCSCTVATFLLLKLGYRGTISQFTYNLSWQHSYTELTHFANYQKSHLKAPALYGVRYVILVWIMMVHTAAIVNFQFLRKSKLERDLDHDHFIESEFRSIDQQVTCCRSKTSPCRNPLKYSPKVPFKWIRSF